MPPVDETVPLLGASDVVVAWGNDDAIVQLVDVAAALPFGTLTVRGSGASSSVTPIRGDREVAPINVRHSASASGWAGDAVDRIDAVSDPAESVLAVLLTGSDTGWLLPARHMTSVPRQRTRHPNTDLTMVEVAWTPTGRSRIVTDIDDIDRDGNHAVQLAAGGEAWLIVTAAGAGQALGIRAVAGNSVQAAGGMRGWLVATVVAEAR